MSLVLHHSKAKGTAKLVLIGVANHEGDGGAWPALATLMRYANLDRRNVQRALTKLVELGELDVLKQQGGNNLTHSAFRPNLYRVQVKCPYNCDRTSQHRLKNSPLPGLEWQEHRDEPMIRPVVANATPPSGANATPPVALTPPEPSFNLIGGRHEKNTQVIRAALTPPPTKCTHAKGHIYAEGQSQCFWCDK